MKKQDNIEQPTKRRRKRRETEKEEVRSFNNKQDRKKQQCKKCYTRICISHVLPCFV
jgi:phosphopantetheinyl transferase